MTARKKKPVILLVESDVVVRFALADFLRACGATVIEASRGQEARAILVSGPSVSVLMSDAQLAGEDNGFELAQWVRRYRPGIEVLLTSSISNKANAAMEFCSRSDYGKPGSDAQALATRIQGLVSESKRRTRPPSTSAPLARPRRRR